MEVSQMICPVLADLIGGVTKITVTTNWSSVLALVYSLTMLLWASGITQLPMSYLWSLLISRYFGSLASPILIPAGSTGDLLASDKSGPGTVTAGEA